MLAESNTQPSIVESFLIDEKKTTLALLISEQQDMGLEDLIKKSLKHLNRIEN